MAFSYKVHHGGAGTTAAGLKAAVTIVVSLFSYQYHIYFI